MLEGKVFETMVYSSIIWGPRASYYGTLRRVYHAFVTRCIGWCIHNYLGHLISLLYIFVKTESKSVGVKRQKMRILVLGLRARMEDSRLSTHFIFEELMEGAVTVG